MSADETPAAPLDAGRDTGEETDTEGLIREHIEKCKSIAHAPGSMAYYYLGPAAPWEAVLAQLAALRARLDASERIREAAERADAAYAHWNVVSVTGSGYDQVLAMRAYDVAMKALHAVLTLNQETP
jgi:fructoselysine-6-P-deglycase FrlB-like protein